MDFVVKLCDLCGKGNHPHSHALKYMAIDSLIKFYFALQRKLFTIHYSLFTKKPLTVLRIRDVEGGEAGTEWSVAEWSTGAKRTPEQARPRA